MELWSFFVQESYLYGISDSQRLVRVGSTLMIDQKPSGEVVCHYCHYPKHDAGIVGGCIIEIEGFRMFMNH